MAPIGENTPLACRISEWTQWNKNCEDQEKVERLTSEGDMTMLKKLFLTRIEFGTAGLRGRMGPGFSQMNDLVIIQTAQGLAHYLETIHKTTEFSIVVGYDGRHNSRRWAELTASIFLRKGSKVYLFSDFCPTPWVPFGVAKYKAVAGVMVTASHNPKEDNGYKVYWNNGAQIIPPHDKGISESIASHLVPDEESWDVISESERLFDPLSDVTDDYMSRMKANLNGSSSTAPPRITYTAMHGVGYPFIVRAFQTANLKEVIPVVEQIRPDPDFPTVVFPNPEEGKSALDLAIKTAEANDSRIILANDPDADRLAIAERYPNGAWKIFTGNEIGALLCWWVVTSFKEKNPMASYQHFYTMSSTVSSKIARTIATAEGLSFEETLTGFKWMGNRADELRKDGKQVLIAFEEAIGFMCRDTVLDKDGISAAAHAGELISHLYSRNETLISQLGTIYEKYGTHLSNNSYYICHDPATIKSIFHRLSHFNEGKANTYPTSICGGEFAISSVRDLHTGYDSAQSDCRAVLPVSSSSFMLTFEFVNGLVATLRTSGTEPKLKYYTEICSTTLSPTDAITTLNKMASAIVNEFLEPKKNSLLA